jgi:hypothetical protein
LKHISGRTGLVHLAAFPHWRRIFCCASDAVVVVWSGKKSAGSAFDQQITLVPGATADNGPFMLEIGTVTDRARSSAAPRRSSKSVEKPAFLQ